MASFHPVRPGRPSRYREVDTLPAVRGLEICLHELRQVIPAFLPVVLGYREQDCVMDLGLDPAKNMRRHLEQSVTHDFPGSVLTNQRRRLGELTAFFNPELPSPVVLYVAATGFLPDTVLPTNEDGECFIHSVYERLSGLERKTRVGGQALSPTSVGPAMTQRLSQLSIRLRVCLHGLFTPRGNSVDHVSICAGLEPLGVLTVTRY